MHRYTNSSLQLHQINLGIVPFHFAMPSHFFLSVLCGHHIMPRATSKTLSLETRNKLLHAVNEEKQSVAVATRRLMVPYTTARSFLQHYQHTGQAETKKMCGNRAPALNDEHFCQSAGAGLNFVLIARHAK